MERNNKEKTVISFLRKRIATKKRLDILFLRMIQNNNLNMISSQMNTQFVQALNLVFGNT